MLSDDGSTITTPEPALSSNRSASRASPLVRRATLSPHIVPICFATDDHATTTDIRILYTPKPRSLRSKSRRTARRDSASPTDPARTPHRHRRRQSASCKCCSTCTAMVTGHRLRYLQLRDTAPSTKPKRGDYTRLRRLRNIAANPNVQVLFDVYDDADWTPPPLPPTPRHRPESSNRATNTTHAVALLRARYKQYARWRWSRGR